MRETLRLILAVIVATVVSAVGLSATYSVTRDRIAEQERLREEESLREVLPGAETFTRITDEEVVAKAEEVSEGVFVSLYRAQEGSATVGWAVRVEPRGYGGPIQMAVGLESSGKVTGVSIISLKETPGLGTKVQDDEFLAQFAGWDAERMDEQIKELDAVTGATKSSNGVRKGVLAASHVYAAVVATGEVE
ncbi:MAG: RnfABCDGE type electron transport complex subunit G [Coriobacteriia bacterium]